MPVRNRSMENRIARLGKLVIQFVAAAGVAGVTALLAIRGEAVAAPPAAARPEQWGPQQGDLRTRLAPLADHFVLGKPMRFRLELKNVGRAVVHYDPQGVDMNGSLTVRDPQGRPVRYVATSFQTMGRKPPA